MNTRQLNNHEMKESVEEKTPAIATNQFGLFPSLQTICFEKVLENEPCVFDFPLILKNQYLDFKKEKTREIAENLLQHKDIDANLALLKKHPVLLEIPVRATGWGDFCYEGTILQMLAMAGDRDLRERREEQKEESVGLVNLLQPLFDDQNKFQAQLAAVFPENHQQIASERMAYVRKAIEDLVSETINSEEIPNNRKIDADEFKQLIMHSEIAQRFRKAIKPTCNPNNPDAHVIKQGFGWDTSIFAELIEQFNQANFQQRFGGLWSNKSDFIDNVVWSALQAQSPLADLQVFSNGICKVIDSNNATCKQLPTRMELTRKDDVERLNGIGVSHFFGYRGDKFSARCAWGAAGAYSALPAGAAPVAFFKSYDNQKQQLYKFTRLQHQVQNQPLLDPVEQVSAQRFRCAIM